MGTVLKGTGLDLKVSPPEPSPWVLLLVLGLAGASLGFDLEDSLIPVEEIQDGGVPVDGIPALENPEWISAEEAESFLYPDDRVIGWVQGEIMRAYPIQILNWHEVVNDSVEEKPIAVTYCPLTGTARAFQATAGGKSLTFGVSGKLYKNNLLFYDRQTKSLWSQIRGEAVTGPMKGTQLSAVSVFVTSWRVWREKYPQTQVLSLNTGFLRDYSQDPYRKAARSPQPLFPMGKIRDDLAAKAWVVGISYQGRAKAYSLEGLKRSRMRRFKDRIGDEWVAVQWVPEWDELIVTDASGNPVPAIRMYWFAWQAFYPETEVYRHA